MPIEEYLALIKNAISKIDDNYYKLETTYEPSGIVRERVFCYELYHQIRVLQSESDKLTLNGEIDKRGHIDFLAEHRKNPDFVFHIPSKFKGNTIVCEVKGIIRSDDGIMKDFETIIIFISNYQYKAGIFILYNHHMEELKNYLTSRIEQLEKLDKKVTSKIHIYVKLNRSNSLESCLLSDIINSLNNLGIRD